MIRLAVFGQPVARSLSPRIHKLFAEQFGLPIRYEAIEATPESFGREVAHLARDGGRGCNVTVPFKNAAWRLATRCSEEANRAEAANTLVFTPGEWFADSTDGGGLVGDIEHGTGHAIQGSRICILGAGGAAGSVLAALLERGPESVTIANRTAEKAVDLAGRHADLGAVTGIGMDELAAQVPFDLVINATSLGHLSGALELPPGLFARDALCYDMNYGEASAPLETRCREQGIRYSDGLGMLVGQAALSFRIWTGEMPDIGSVLAVLRDSAGK